MHLHVFYQINSSTVYSLDIFAIICSWDL